MRFIERDYFTHLDAFTRLLNVTGQNRLSLKHVATTSRIIINTRHMRGNHERLYCSFKAIPRLQRSSRLLAGDSSPLLRIRCPLSRWRTVISRILLAETSSLMRGKGSLPR